MQHMNITDILLLQKERQLRVVFADGKKFNFSHEYLRVFSPSAEVRAHDGTMHWPKNKTAVNIEAIEPIGLYAVKLYFDDGHHSGIYTFDYFYELMQNFSANWQRYQTAVAS
jgi:DUF971 family protein